MKVLLVGQADSIFFENYTKTIKLCRKDITFDVFSIDPIKNRYDLSSCQNIFQSNWDNTFISRIRGINSIIRPIHLCVTLLLFLHKNSAKYDIIHYKWLVSGVTLLSLINNPSFKKSIATLWGSEIEFQKILFSRNIYYFFLRRFLKKANTVTYHSDQQLESLKKLNLTNSSKSSYAIYGSTIYSQIEELINKESKTDSKSLLQIDIEKITISLGYSGKELHQHEKIIHTLSKNELFLKKSEQFLFILPFTHGGTKDYYKRITDSLDEIGFKYLLLSEKMSDNEVARLRNATDIMLQLSVSDGRSASIIESLLTGTIVISGEWLPYKIFHEKGIYFHEINKIDSSLALKLLEITQNLNKELDKCKLNADKMGFETWEKVIPNWINIYEKVIRNS